MATPLSDEIRALIAYANETTEADDTKLGDCVNTLVDGYNGGNNVPSSPLVIPTGALSSRLASLLAYANETTGMEDSLVGDAIRTLCDGYGGEAQITIMDWISNNGTSSSITIPLQGQFVRVDITSQPVSFVNSSVQKKVLDLISDNGNLLFYGQNGNCYVWDTRKSTSLRVSNAYTSAAKQWTMAYNASSVNKYVFGVGGSWASGSLTPLYATSAVVFPYNPTYGVYNQKIMSLVISDAMSGELIYDLQPAKIGRRYGLYDEGTGSIFFADDGSNNIIGGRD